jgi:hypothetical protein
MWLEARIAMRNQNLNRVRSTGTSRNTVETGSRCPPYYGRNILRNTPQQLAMNAKAKKLDCIWIYSRSTGQFSLLKLFHGPIQNHLATQQKRKQNQTYRTAHGV